MQVKVPLKLQNLHRFHHQKKCPRPEEWHLTLPPSYSYTTVILNRPVYRSNTFQKLKRKAISTQDNKKKKLDQQIVFQTALPIS